MAHAYTAPRASATVPGILAALAIAAAIGFTLGQSWPVEKGSNAANPLPVEEDWHGNVRRSHWTN